MRAPLVLSDDQIVSCAGPSIGAAGLGAKSSAPPGPVEGGGAAPGCGAMPKSAAVNWVANVRPSLRLDAHHRNAGNWTSSKASHWDRCRWWGGMAGFTGGDACLLEAHAIGDPRRLVRLDLPLADGDVETLQRHWIIDRAWARLD